MSKKKTTEEKYKNHPYWKYEHHAESYKIDEARGCRGVRTSAALYYAKAAEHTCGLLYYTTFQIRDDSARCAACIMTRALSEIHYNLTMR
jgi:hypothetical protein